MCFCYTLSTLFCYILFHNLARWSEPEDATDEIRSVCIFIQCTCICSDFFCIISDQGDLILPKKYRSNGRQKGNCLFESDRN